MLESERVCSHDHIIAVGTRRTTAHWCTNTTEDLGAAPPKAPYYSPTTAFWGFPPPLTLRLRAPIEAH